MITSARIIADSINPNGQRVVSIEDEFPRIILAEFNTHRVFSRNSASSRARPINKVIEDVLSNPFIPLSFPVNQRGMSATEYLTEGSKEYDECVIAWLMARDQAVIQARRLMGLGIHKQITNRLLEPFMSHTVIVTATEYDNFFELRISEFAQPEIRAVAEAMRAAIDASTPRALDWGDWHLPYVSDDEIASVPVQDLVKVSSARCARTSYLTQNGVRDVREDLALYDRLVGPKHLSPLEHPCMASEEPRDWANFRGWMQHRRQVE